MDPQSTPNRPPVAIIGAGLAGLSAAHRLREAGHDVKIFESAKRVGGIVRSVRHGEHLFEHGPTTVPSTAPRLASLLDDAGLRPKTVLSRTVAGRRLVWRRGRLHALPEKPPHLLTCTALGPLAKLRLLAEPLVPARRGGEPETLEQFGRRRLGRGAVDAFLDPFITGVYAGRLDRLGVDAVPRLLDLEAEHGSLFRGVIAARKTARGARSTGDEKKPGPPPLISFPEGLEALPRLLAEPLGSALELDHTVEALEVREDGYRLQFQGDAPSFLASAVVLAAPAEVAARLLPGEVGARGFLDAIPHPFVATVGLAYDRGQVTHPLDAFGLLVASDSRPPEADVLGILFASSIFDGRAPEGGVTLTVMIGGGRDPGAAELDDADLISRARSATALFLGAAGAPKTQTLARWPRAIPQYQPGHRQKVAELRSRLAAFPGLAVAGNYLDGIGVEGAVASGEAAAEDVRSALA